jgi:hypothetical protein
MEVPPADAPLVCELVWMKLTTQVEEEGLTLVVSKISLSHSSTNLRSSSSVFFACLSNAKLIIASISLWEGDGLGRTMGIISGLLKTIGVVS